MVIVAVIHKAGIDFIDGTGGEIIPENPAMAVVDQGFPVGCPVGGLNECVKEVNRFAPACDGIVDLQKRLIIIAVPDAVFVDHTCTTNQKITNRVKKEE